MKNVEEKPSELQSELKMFICHHQKYIQLLKSGKSGTEKRSPQGSSKAQQCGCWTSKDASKCQTCTKRGTNLLNRLHIDPNTLSIRIKTIVRNKSKTLNKRLSQKQRTSKANKRGKGQEREGDAKTSLQ